MRRPLAGAGLVFVLILLLIQLLMGDRVTDYSYYDGRTITVSGRLMRIESRLKDGVITWIWYIKDTDISEKDSVMCRMSQEYPEAVLGSFVSIYGKAGCFSHASNPGAFDMADYYDCMRVAFSLNGAELTGYDASGLNPYWRMRGGLQRIRHNIGILCDLCFNDDDSPVIRGILLGDKSLIDNDIRDLYSRNGIAHILAISGLHISMLGMGFASLMKKCRVPISLTNITVILLMIMYGLMTGMAASACRAIIMFSLRMIAQVIGRTYDAATALVIAALMLLFEQPAYLFYSGFQFSFGAIAAVLLVIPVLEDVIPKPVAGGVSVNVITLPIYLYNYFFFPVLSVLLNFIIIPLMSVLLGCAIIALAGCALYIPLGRLLAFPAHLILLIYEYTCRICDLIPWNRFVTGKPGTLQIILYCLIVGGVLLFRRYQTGLQIVMHMLFAGIILTLNLHFGISVTLIDVGQGDGIYITDHAGSDIMIDGGSTSEKSVGEYELMPYLYSQGVASLDGVFITHMDADHYNGIVEMLTDNGLNGPRIDCLYLTSSAAAGDSDAYRLIREAAESGGIPVEIITQGDLYVSGKLELECLYPDASCRGADTNNESLVMRLRYGDVNMLFTGDLGGDGELALDELIRSSMRPEDTLILKVAHHGSKYSSLDGFLDLAGPDLALISAGKDNSYGHPHAELIGRLEERGIPWFNTADHGAITVDIRGGSVKVSGFLD